jgi:hypothetical protein
MKQFFPRISFYNLRLFTACLLSFLMLTAPIAPLAGTSNNTSHIQTNKTKKAEAERAAPGKLSPNPLVNPFSPLTPMAPMPFVATVTAALDDNFSLASKKNPGDTINYTAVITNNTLSDVSVLAYTDTLDINTTLSGVVRVSPVTVNDSYTCTGNVSISVPVGSGVLVNDYLGQNPAGTITASDVASTQGGTVTVNADGSFTYNPPANFTGADTFTYTLQNVTGTSVGTVTINVADRILFVASGGVGNCKPATPCSLATAEALVAPSFGKDLVFVESGTYGSAVFSLNGSQTIAGQAISIGTALTDAGITLAPNSQTLTFPASTVPVLNNAGTVVSLNTNTLVEDLTINPSAGSGVLGNAITSGTTTVRDLTIGATGAANGVNLTSNTGGTFNFSNIVITGVSGTGFNATGGGTVNVTGATNTLTTTTGKAVNANGVTFGASGATFKSISANGGNNGITLQSTSGNFTVTGDGTGHANGSGGTIQNITGNVIGNAPAYLLTASGTITLKSMNMSLDASTATSSAFSGMLVDNNAGGTIIVNVTGCTFTGRDPSLSNTTQNKASLQFEGGNTGGNAANVTVNVQNSFFNFGRTYGLFATAAGDSIMNVTLNQSGFGTDVNSGAPVNNPGTAITNPPPFSVGITNGSNSKVDYTVTNNTFWGASGTAGAIYVVTISGASTTATSHLNGTISGNKIGKTGVVGSGCTPGCAGIGILPGTQGAYNAIVTNNDIRQINADGGIALANTVGGGATFTSNLHIKNNTLAEPDTTGSPLFLRAIVVSPGNSGGANTSVCAEIGGPGGGEPNIISGAWTSTMIRVTNNNNSTALVLPGLSPASGATAAQVQTFVAGNNGGATVLASVGTAGINGGALCPLLLMEGGVMAALNAPSLVSSLLLSSLSTSPITIDARRSTITEPNAVSTSLNQQQLDSIVAAAIQRWSAAGLTAQQIAILRVLKFEIADLQGAYLGEADGNRIQVDRKAEGKGWFVDANPMSDSNFARAVSATRLYTDPMNAAAGHVDLLTAIEHEIGHKLGLDDSYLEKDRDNIMYGYLTVGERRVPALGQARGAQPGALKGSHFLSLRSVSTVKSRLPYTNVTPFSGETISFSLPVVLNVGKSVTIKYDATINVPPGAAFVQTQGNVTFTGGPGGGINTTDPETSTQIPTKTNINTAITWIGVTSTDWDTASNWDFNYVPVSFSDVKVPNAAQPNHPTLSTTSPTINSLNLGNTRTLTISGQTLTISGNSGSDLTLDGNINGGALAFGAGTHTIFNAGPTGSITPTNTTTVLSGANVTLNNNLQMDSLTINGGGTLNITSRTLSLTGSLNNGGTFTTVARGDGANPSAPPGDGLQVVNSTVVFNGTGAQTLTNTTAFNNLTINNSGGSVTLGSNATVNGTLTLTSDLTTTNSFTLTMPTSTGVISGGADVVGNITRTNGGPSLPTGTNIAFGNPNTTLNFIVQGTVPTSINFRLTKTAPDFAATGGTNTGFPGAVTRTWLITPTGGVGFKATMQLHYSETLAELNGNVETNPGPGSSVSLRMYKYVINSPGTGWQQQDFPNFNNTTIDTSSPGNHFVKYTNVTSFSPWTIGGVSPTAATSTVSGRILDDAGNPVEGAVIRLNGTQNRKTITDAFGNYSFVEVETNGFYTVTPSRVNYNFAPVNRGFSALGAHTEASFAASSTNGGFNPLDTTEYFVRQQYVDFLGREPEEKGFNDWTDTINNCAPGDTTCDRVHVSEMFFRSEEFQQRGYFVYRFYSTAFGQKPDYAAFAPDLGRVSGFLDATQLEAAKTQFASDFTSRAAFVNQYGTLSNAQYVDALAQTAGVTLSNRQALVNSLEAGTLTRAQALRQIVESGEVFAKYYNQAFVVMEYFGYLRRDPDLLYLNWISVLDANPADSRRMVEGFVDATEYRNRFKQ